MEKCSLLMEKEGVGACVLIIGHKCYRCGHKWVPRDIKELPEICPLCKSPYWKTPKKIFRKGEKRNGKY